MCKAIFGLPGSKLKRSKAAGVASAAPGSAVTDQRLADRNAARPSSGGSYFSGAQFGQLTGGAQDFRISLFQKG